MALTRVGFVCRFAELHGVPAGAQRTRSPKSLAGRLDAIGQAPKSNAKAGRLVEAL